MHWVKDVDARYGPVVGYDVRNRRFDGVSVEMHLPKRQGQSLELVYVGSDLLKAHLEVARRLVDMKHRGPQGLRFIRKTSGVHLSDFARKVSVDSERVLAWESGELPVDDAIVSAYHSLI